MIFTGDIDGEEWRHWHVRLVERRRRWSMARRREWLYLCFDALGDIDGD